MIIDQISFLFYYYFIIIIMIMIIMIGITFFILLEVNGILRLG